MARDEMTGDFVQVNGDKLFRADLAARLLAARRGSGDGRDQPQGAL